MTSIMPSMFVLLLFHVYLSYGKNSRPSRLPSCEDVFSHKNWPLLDNKGYCGTYDTTEEPEQFYTVEDPERVGKPEDDDYDTLPDDKIEDQGFPRIEPRIQQGDRAGKREFPWMAQLIWLNNSGTVPDCGGTLINKRYVLTSAHCLVKTEGDDIFQRSAEEYKIRLGTDKRVNRCGEDKVCQGFEDFGVEEINIHEEAGIIEVNDTNIFENDIALLRLNRDALFLDGVITPVCLPKCSMLKNMFNQIKTVVAGFGEKFLDPTPEYPKVLQKFYPTVKNPGECSAPFPKVDRSICAGDVTGDSGACGGDEGGPLMLLRSESSRRIYYQIGVLSFSSRECAKGALNFFQDMVFARVAYYVPWILDTVWE